MTEPDDHFAIACARIAAEAEERTGTLDLSGLRRLQTLPDTLSHLRHLQVVDCSDTQVSDLEPLAGLTALASLHCSRTQVSDLGPLAGLTALASLDCSGTQVSDLGPLAGLTALASLHCSRTQVSDLGPLAGLTALASLHCSRTQVSDLGPLAGLTALASLDCFGTQVSDLGPLAGLTALASLSCFHTQVSDLGPLAGLTALASLDCSGTKVSDLGPLAGLTALASLGCSGTQVSDLGPLAGLTALASLHCSRTQVSDLGPLAGLAALASLDCSRCRLAGLPSEVAWGESMSRLILHEAHVSGFPGTGIFSRSDTEDCIEAVRAHLADAAGGEVPANDAKLLLLGNGRAGKTQIARWLIGKEGFNPAWDSTHGVQVTETTLPGDPEAKLHVWDFGGQELYHGTHALFLNSPAVLMPVWAEDTERVQAYEHDGLTFRNHPLDYWVDVARSQGHEDSPVLLVQAKCDAPAAEALHFPMRDETWKAIRYRRTLHVSCKEGRGREQLALELRQAVTHLRDPARSGGARIGAVRLRVQRRLEAMRAEDAGRPPAERRHRWLERDRFESICAEEGGVSSPDYLLDYLDAIGTVFHRPGLFGGRVVLDQAWALDAVYAVFQRSGALQAIRGNDGRFWRSMLAHLVWREHGKAEQELFISMMRSCGICFLHRKASGEDGSEDQYIAPDLLPDFTRVVARLPGRWDEEPGGESAVFRYELLHAGLIRTVIAAVGELAGLDALYWQGGVCGYDANTGSRLRIEQVPGAGWAGEIKVRTQRGQAAQLLDRLVTLVEEAQGRLGMRPSGIARSSQVDAPALDVPLSLTQERSDSPEVYISYASGDGTPAGLARQKASDAICGMAKARGYRVWMAEDSLRTGDDIEEFMNRIGAGKRVFVILSAKYLQSPYCMYELRAIWQNCLHSEAELRRRIRVYTLGDVDIWDSIARSDHARFWRDKYNALRTRVAEDPSIVSIRTHTELRLMDEFYRRVDDILSGFVPIKQARSLDEFEEYGFS